VVLPKPFEDYKNPSKVVLSLMVDLYGKGYNLALDNLYTSPDLLKALFQNSFDAYGTLRKKVGMTLIKPNHKRLYRLCPPNILVKLPRPDESIMLRSALS